MNQYFVLIVILFNMPISHVVPRLNKLPRRKKSPLKFLIVFFESLDCSRTHRWNRREVVIWKKENENIFTMFRMGRDRWSLTAWNPLTTLLCVLCRFYTSEWMTEWCTHLCWNLSTKVFILNKGILSPGLSDPVLQKISRVSPIQVLGGSYRKEIDYTKIWVRYDLLLDLSCFKE